MHRREGEAQRTGKDPRQMEQVQRYYSRIIGARRINAPSYSEAQRDLEQQQRVLIG